MQKFYRKSELGFAIAWIVFYCVLMSVGDSLSAEFGIINSVSLPVAALLSAVLYLFIKRSGLKKKYGLCKPEVKASELLYYIPLLLILTVNLWYGVKLNTTAGETVLYVLKMLCVGFLEEVIFRGLLFKAMLKDNVKAAVVVSSVTFGIGHIINLFNGSGAELIPNILQVVYAVAAGFMFIMLFQKSGSLIPCIITHGVFNALSIFCDEASLSIRQRVISCIFLVAVSGAYSVYISVSRKADKKC